MSIPVARRRSLLCRFALDQFLVSMMGEPQIVWCFEGCAWIDPAHATEQEEQQGQDGEAKDRSKDRGSEDDGEGPPEPPPGPPPPAMTLQSNPAAVAAAEKRAEAAKAAEQEETGGGGGGGGGGGMRPAHEQLPAPDDPAAVRAMKGAKSGCQCVIM